MAKKRFEGVIKRIFIKELTQEEIDRVSMVPGKGNVQINEGKTHKVSFEDTAGLWYNFGSIKVRPGDPLILRRDCGDGWQDIYDGASMFFFYDEKQNGQYTNRNVQKATFQLLANGQKPEKVYTYGSTSQASTAPAVQGATSTPSKYDPKGAMIGNAHNNSLILVDYDLSKGDLIDQYAVMIYQINTRIQESTKANGATVGMAVNNAVHITKDINKVEEVAMKLLKGHIQTIDDYVHKGTVPAAVNKSIEKTIPTVAPKTAAPPDDLDDDSIPF